jgi:hypothetical protein
MAPHLLEAYVDKDLDFAVLRSPVKGAPLPLRAGPITDGEAVAAVGFPQGRDLVAASTGTLLGADGRVLGVNTVLIKRRGDWANVTDRPLAIKISTVLKTLGAQ